jgi:hypothetical protein
LVEVALFSQSGCSVIRCAGGAQTNPYEKFSRYFSELGRKGAKARAQKLTPGTAPGDCDKGDKGGCKGTDGEGTEETREAIT